LIKGIADAYERLDDDAGAAPSSKFAANFSRLGFRPGFGITATLPRVVGQQKALEWMLTGERSGWPSVLPPRLPWR